MGIGAAMMLTGIGLRQWAIASLGRFFTRAVMIHPEHELLTGGPYRWVRHPSYTGYLITLAGLGLRIDDWLSLLVLVIVPLAGVLYRIHVEKDALHTALGQPYAQDRKVWLLRRRSSFWFGRVGVKRGGRDSVGSHVLLGALRLDVVDELLESGEMPETIR